MKIYSIVMLCISWNCGPYLSSATQDLETEFVRMAPKGWENLMHGYQNLRGSLEIESYSGLEKIESISIKFLTRGSSERIERRSDRDQRALIICRNHREKYFFVLTENLEGPRYQLVELLDYPEDMSLYQADPGQNKLVNSLFKYIRSPWVFESYSFPLLLKEDGFKIVKVSESDDDPNLVSVDFEFVSQRPDLVSNIENGNAVFSRKHSWGLVRFTGKLSWGWIRSEIEYDENSNPLVIPKKITQEYWSEVPGSGKLGTHFQCKVKEFEKHTASPREFTLSSFGLPEPKRHQPRLSGIMMFFVGVGLIGLCILLNQLLRQR